MRADFWAEAKHRQEDLNKLASREGSKATLEKDTEFAVTVFKILTLIGSVFLSLTALTTLPPDLAILSISLILFATAVLLSGSKKIIQVFPRYQYYGVEPSTVIYHPPSRSLWPFSRRSTCSTSPGHHVPVGSAYSPPSSPPSRRSVSWWDFSSETPTSQAATTTGSGGHTSRDTVTREGNVGVGSGRSNSETVTSSGNVGVGSGNDRRTASRR
jgi:hypothetical protein